MTAIEASRPVEARNSPRFCLWRLLLHTLRFLLTPRPRLRARRRPRPAEIGSVTRGGRSWRLARLGLEHADQAANQSLLVGLGDLEHGVALGRQMLFNRHLNEGAKLYRRNRV